MRQALVVELGLFILRRIRMNTELHPFSRSDFKELISWIRDPEELFIWSATTFTFPLDENQLERH